MKVSIGVDLGRPGGDHSAFCAYCPECGTVVATESVPGGEPYAKAEARVRAAGEKHVCPKGQA